MAYRRNAWNQPTFRKVGASSAAGAPTVGGVDRFWRTGVWYVGADWQQIAGSGGSTVPYGVAGAADFIYAFPVVFDRAGTIVALGQHIGTNAGRVWMGVYSALASNVSVPDARQFDVEKIAPGFNQPVTATGLTIAVTAGETKWFAAVYNAGGVSGGCINVGPNFLRTQGGTDWDGVTGGAPTIAGFAGYRHAFAYAQLPATFPGGGAPTQLKTNAANAPVTMFQFTPS